MQCPACGQENPEGFRLCGMCGAALAPEAPERRKLATMLFCDMSGSTAMGERVDAESVREMMFSYFHEMRGAIERHGGTVEKFIGDAVMAVFGVPVAHEDDALRAVRAAWEMQERLTSLNAELDRRYGSTIALRIGVNTGEIVAGDATLRQVLVTGDAVNVAARLEQAAEPGQILIGEPTYRLVRDAVTAEPVDPLEAKGKSEPLPAYRLMAVETTAPARARRLDTEIVGRRAELALLRSKVSEAAAGRCVLATVVGEPGVGKSRLAAELIASADGFRTFTGRCLEYGEGITYWPIAEIVREAAGIHDEHSREDALHRLEGLLPDGEAGIVAQAIGLAEGEAGTDEIAAAVAALFGTLACERPLLLFVDDIHWGEAALRQLLAGLPDALGSSPVLVLCLARPDLLEDQPDWPVTVRLEPLEQSDATALVGRLLGEAPLPEGLAERISTAAAGNPLFVEELVGMLVDDGLLERRNGSWVSDPGLAGLTIPPTLRELLGARLDRMGSGERSVLERGAVEGQLFHAGAVLALSDDGARAAVPEQLQALVEREHIRPARADFAEEAAYRFRHILIRDAAYEAVPKKIRGGLHERFADWLEERAGDRVGEFDEILGYHLEQAYRLREELGPVTDDERALALRAAEHLGAGGQRALARRDAGAAVGLLLRAADLRPRHDPTRLEQMESAGHLLIDAGDVGQGASIFTRALEEATTAGNQPLAARLEMYAAWTRLILDPEYGVAAIGELAERLEPALSAADDNLSLARLHDMLAYTHDLRRRSKEVERETEIGIAYARAGNGRWHELELHWWLFWQQPQGPRPVEAAIRRCHDLREQIGDDLAAEAAFFESLAQLEAMRGRFGEARELIASSITNRAELGLRILTTKYSLPALGLIELLAGKPRSAESALRRTCEEAQQAGDPETTANAASLLIEALLAQDRLDEIEELLPLAEQAAAGDAVAPHVRWRCAQAKYSSRTGDRAAAESMAQEAVRLTVDTDDLNLQGAAWLTLAEVSGDEAAAREALRRFEQKGNLVAAETARALLGELAAL